MSALGNLDMTYHNDWLQLPGSNNVFADFTTVHNPAISLAANSRSHGHDTQARSFQGDSYLIPDSFQQQTPHATAQNPPPVSFDAFSTAPTKRQGLPKQTTSERPNKRTRTRQWDNTWGYLDVDTSNMFGHDDDDAQSVCSTCSDTCPSHCGETGPGGLCCDADDCEAQATEELCIDEACEGANNPCTDENCLGDALTPSGTREEAAAAAALTSFNDIGDLNSIGSFTEGNQFGSFGNDFSLGPNQQLTGQASHGMDFSNMHTAPDAQFNMLSTDSVATASSNGQNMAWTWPPNLEYLNHLVQYHDPSQDNTHHMRPCLADYPSFVGTKCPLPAPNYDTNDLNDIWSQNPDIQCGYSAQDPAIFADHLKTQHKTFISNFTGFDLGPISWGQTQQGNYNSAQEFSDASQANHNLQTTSFQGTGPDANSRGSRQISSSTPSGTITSTRTAPLPTPVSPLSPPLFEHPHPKLESPQPPMTIDRHQHQSLGLENAYQCFWKDPKTGETCLENFKDSDELHDHCKNEHTKISAKAEDGFRCMWHSCRREDECFATKAKLNRHLQTHTGCELNHTFELLCHANTLQSNLWNAQSAA